FKTSRSSLGLSPIFYHSRTELNEQRSARCCRRTGRRSNPAARRDEHLYGLPGAVISLANRGGCPWPRQPHLALRPPPSPLRLPRRRAGDGVILLASALLFIRNLARLHDRQMTVEGRHSRPSPPGLRGERQRPTSAVARWRRSGGCVCLEGGAHPLTGADAA